jgi:hypothetical protein
MIRYICLLIAFFCLGLSPLRADYYTNVFGVTTYRYLHKNLKKKIQFDVNNFRKIPPARKMKIDRPMRQKGLAALCIRIFVDTSASFIYTNKRLFSAVQVPFLQPLFFTNEKRGPPQFQFA